MKKAFSLIELMIVIAIFAILLTILQPSLNKALNSARQITCRSNLQTVMSAEEMAMNDGTEYLPAGVYIPAAFRTTEKSEAKSRNMKHWPGHLSTYLGSNYTISIWSEFEVPNQFQCPDDEVISKDGKNITNTISYGLNGGISWDYSRNDRFIYKDEVPDPSSLVIFSDSDRNESRDYNIQGTNHVWAYPGFVHENRALAIFADMHAEALFDFEMGGLGKKYE